MTTNGIALALSMAEQGFSDLNAVAVVALPNQLRAFEACKFELFSE